MLLRNFILAILLVGDVGLAIFAAVDTKMNASPPTGEELDIRAMRMLRIYSTSTKNNEERAIPGLEKITTSLKASTSEVVDVVKLRIWLDMKTSLDDAWKLLQLNEKLDDVIANPNLKIFGDYVDMVNKKYPDKQVSLAGMLSSRYGDDTVVTTLVSAMSVENTHAIATKLLKQQLHDWITSGKSVDDAFKILKISDDGPRFMTNPKLEVLHEYIGLFNTKKPHEETKFFSVLTNGFGGDGKFAIVVSKAMEIPSLQEDALYFQAKLFRKCYKNNIEPSSILSRVFNTDEKTLASVGAREKSIVNDYKKLYDEELGLDQIPSVINPRRM